MLAAISWPVTPRGNAMVLPSGKVMVMVGEAAAADKPISRESAVLRGLP
jgi:hypothetical protein